MKIIAAFGLWMALFLSAAVHADDLVVDVNGTRLVLNQGQGICQFSENNASEARLMRALEKALAGSVDILALSTSCEDLKDWHERRIKTLKGYAVLGTISAIRHLDLTGQEADFVNDMCNSFALVSDSEIEKESIEIEKRIKEEIPLGKNNGNQLLGVFERTPSECHQAIIENHTTEFGDRIQVIGIKTPFVLKGKSMVLMQYSTYEGEQSLQKALDLQKSDLIRIRAANRP